MIDHTHGLPLTRQAEILKLRTYSITALPLGMTSGDERKYRKGYLASLIRTG